MSFILSGCKFTFINQPKKADANEVIEVSLQIRDDLVPELNAHKGVLCVLVPNDWSFVSGKYQSTEGDGDILLSEDWADSATINYPPEHFGTEMKWIGLISDSGYSYEDPMIIDVNLVLQVGTKEGCFDLAYLSTKATGGLISNPSWVAFSYPHPIGIPDSIGCTTDYSVEPAPEWDKIFDRRNGWTGADGIYSIPLSGNELPGDDNDEKHLIVFSDTFIGEVDENKKRQNSVLVNNTYALQEGLKPEDSKVDFFWNTDVTGVPKTVFIPDTPESDEGDWYWLMDGIAIGENIYIYALRLEKGDGGFFNFRTIGVNLIKFNLSDDGSISNPRQFDTPLFVHDESDNSDIAFGQALMPMNSESGNPNSDGYIYIYGPKNSASGKELVAGRFLPGNIENFELYEYWDGSNWVNNQNKIETLAKRISQEFSVTPLNEGTYLLVAQVGNTVSVSFGESPVGPFSFLQQIYVCPEPSEIPSTFVYNAKAHPSLSKENRLLISYNVNTFDFGDLFNNADTYRPRFITLDLDSFTTLEESSKLSKFQLMQNYPNPFNGFTNIQFSLPTKLDITITITNVLGKKVTILADNKNYSEGFHSILWDAGELPSGVYLCHIKAENYNAITKMVLVK